MDEVGDDGQGTAGKGLSLVVSTGVPPGFPALGLRKGRRRPGQPTSCVTLGAHSPLWGFVKSIKREREALLRGSGPSHLLTRGPEPARRGPFHPGTPAAPRPCPSRHLAREPPPRPLPPRAQPRSASRPVPAAPRLPSSPRLGRPLTGQAPQLQEPPARSAERAGYRRHLGSGHVPPTPAQPLPPSRPAGASASREKRVRGAGDSRRSGEGVLGTR